MKITTILTLTQLHVIAEMLDFKLNQVSKKPQRKDGRNVYTFTVKPGPTNPHREIGYRGRKVHAIGYDNYGKFMASVFKCDPVAVIETHDPTANRLGRRKYDGTESFNVQTGFRFSYWTRSLTQ
jgi:hypothetical protein